MILTLFSVSGSLQRLVEMLDNGSDEEKIEAAWCLNNISAGTDDHARMVIDAACDSLIRGLSSGNVPLEVSFPYLIVLSVSCFYVFIIFIVFSVLNVLKGYYRTIFIRLKFLFGSQQK